jgi:hypothetical protein
MAGEKPMPETRGIHLQERSRRGGCTFGKIDNGRTRCRKVVRRESPETQIAG